MVNAKRFLLDKAGVQYSVLGVFLSAKHWSHYEFCQGTKKIMADTNILTVLTSNTGHL